MKRTTIADVAKRANVSKSTVSQYLNGRYEYMGEETKKKIEEAIKELKFQPNIVARSLKQKKTSTIGVIVANILHAFQTEVIRAIEDICHQHDYHVIVCNSDDVPEKEKKYIEMLIAKQVDGLIVFPTNRNTDLYKQLVERRYPLVFMDRLVKDVGVDTVLLHNENAAKMAIEHFLEKGYERIGIVTTSLVHQTTPRVERIEGYKKTLNEKDIPIREEYIIALPLEQIKAGLKKMFSVENPPQALLAGNDLALMKILEFTKEQGLSVPNDVALIGIDNPSFAHIYHPALTTIRPPSFEMGKKAADLLFEAIANRKPDQTARIYRFEPELIHRQSV